MKENNISFTNKYKKPISILHEYIFDNKNREKTLIPHLLRVGEYLHTNGYSENIVIAGLLHDLIEWSDFPESFLQKEFGNNVYNIILANTKNRSIQDPIKRRSDYIDRCIKVGISALIVKSADIIDSYNFYKKIGNKPEVDRSVNIANLILQKLPKHMKDPIFEKIRELAKNG